MNAAAKMIYESSVFQGDLFKVKLSKQTYGTLVLGLFLLVTGLSEIYVIHQYRSTCAQLQAKQQEAHQLQLQWGQLLLEQGSLSTPARVELLAKETLHMTLPVRKQLFVLRVR